MSMRIDKSWVVLASIENYEKDRCVDLFARADGTFGFEEFRRDVEDQGRWTAIRYHSVIAYESEAAALQAATHAVGWFAEVIAHRAAKA